MSGLENPCVLFGISLDLMIFDALKSYGNAYSNLVGFQSIFLELL